MWCYPVGMELAMDTNADILIGLLADVEQRHAETGRAIAMIRNAVRADAQPAATHADEDFVASWLLKLYGTRREAD